MRYRKLDENGDYTFGRRNEFLNGAEAAAQAVVTRLRLLLGEWWEDTREGLPLYEDILNTFHSSDARAEQVDLIFSERILGTIGVSEILSFNSTFDPTSRVYSAVCVIKTIFGDTVNLSINGNGGNLEITT